MGIHPENCGDFRPEDLDAICALARELVDMGWYLSFNGAATFKNARKAPEVIRAVPMDRLMIETDAPYLVSYTHLFLIWQTVFKYEGTCLYRCTCRNIKICD